ncbi:MAG TPA: hypothetical protein VE287_12700 [Actinopolymorphaceae bacterium]|nr:hypothetical protein [Actinopolymorphaceae bacterium]
MVLTLGLVIIGVVIAFAAGSRWRHSRRTWADHKLARSSKSTYGRLRWTSLTVAAGFIIILAAYLIGLARMAVGG